VPPAYSDEQLDAAVEALADPERFREAEAMVAAAAPKLQRILMAAIARDEDEWSEDAQVGMLVGVAVGWALSDELRKQEDES
jgi:hypothetical protein